MEEPRDTYTVIPGWTKRLGLSLVEKVVYCVIYGFSQDADSTFRGSRAYLAGICECSVDTVDRALKKLLALGLISKKDSFVGGVKFCEYSVAATGRNLQGVAAICPGGSRNLRHNNEDTIVSSNNDIIEKEARAREEEDDPFAWPPKEDTPAATPSPLPSPSPKTATRFTPPTLEEVAAYCRERGNHIDPQHFVNYYSANGWMVGKNKMKDWRAAVRNWETRDKERNNGKRNIDPGSPAAYRHLGKNDYYGESTI